MQKAHPTSPSKLHATHNFFTTSKSRDCYLSMLLDKLNGLQQALGLIHIASNGHVVDGDLFNVAIRVDDEEAPEGYACVLRQHPILRRDLLRSHNDAQQLPTWPIWQGAAVC